MRFVLLDGLRGVAALLVLVFHAGNMAEAKWLVPNGALAVDFFFALSGFVIALAYERKLQTGMSVQDFMRLRLIRLYPMIAIGLSIGTIILVLRIVLQHLPELIIPAALSVGLNAVLLPSPFFTLGNDIAWPINGPHWSLTYELIANFLYGALLFRLRGYWFGLLLAISAAVLAAVVVERGSIDMGGTVHTLHFGLARVTFPFFAGVGLYRLYKLKGIRQQTNNVMATICAVLLAASLLIPIEEKLKAAYEVAFVLILTPCIIWLSSRFNVTGRVEATCKWLGAISYPLYATHYPILKAAGFITRRFSLSETSQFALYGGFACISIVLAQVALTYADTPLRNWLSSKVSRRGVATA